MACLYRSSYPLPGFDDNMLAQLLRPRLTTIHQNVARKAEKAVKILLELLDDKGEQPKSIQLPTRLIKGATVCPPSTAESL